MQEVSIYRGIEYVRLAELPEEQRSQIKNWLSSDMLIKIQTEKELLTECIVYKDYVHWFNNIFTKISPAEAATKTATSKIKPKAKPYSGLAFDQ